ncbi:LacI family transcriptional regulator [Hungatella effluvii]|uniref:LacI family transcriptional regulator n=1 Tax=Hungatella effluvii TaxID=1096246 RepID=A0A2V3XX85_9FIRM|nr:LacI family DNA-binding transcriptional regulator [Hungatella effluvii]PXX49221.1 LacI family transcriptional regulator [Hungatella effluvii]
MKKTINDVAEKAGVSPSTVSRVLNQSGYVSKKTVKKVMDAVKELGYSPSAIAVSLSKSKTNIIGFVVPDICESFFSEIFYRGDQLAQKKGYRMILCNSDYSVEKEAEAIRDLLSYKVCGVIVIPVTGKGKGNRDLFNQISQSGTPVVCVDRELPGVECDGVYIDNLYASYEIVSDLLERGYRDIALLNYKHDYNRELRYESAVKAMKEYGIEPKEGRFIYLNNKKEGVGVIAELIRGSNPPEAILSFSPDLFTASSYAVFLCGKRVPEDIMLAGYDMLNVSKEYGYEIKWAPEPSDMGMVAARMLLERIEQEEELPYQRVILQSHMKIIGEASVQDKRHSVK